MRNRHGFTLVELMIVMVISALVGTAIVKLFVSQAQFFDRQTQSRESRTVSRSALNILMTDLRMVETTNGVVDVDVQTLVVRVPYAFGLVCNSTLAATTISRLPLDDTLYPDEVFSGYSWLDGDGVYTYVAANGLPEIGAAGACEAESITTLAGGAVLTLTPGTAGAIVGSPVFLYQTVTYEFRESAAVPGRIALWRAVDGQAEEELIAPFDESARFRFFVNNMPDPQDAPPALGSELRGVELVLPGTSERAAVGASGYATSDLTTAVFFKNRLN